MGFLTVCAGNIRPARTVTIKFQTEMKIRDLYYHGKEERGKIFLKEKVAGTVPCTEKAQKTEQGAQSRERPRRRVWKRGEEL